MKKNSNRTMRSVIVAALAAGLLVAGAVTAEVGYGTASTGTQAYSGPSNGGVGH